jgi:rhamnose transport system ATP-binding protein
MHATDEPAHDPTPPLGAGPTTRAGPVAGAAPAYVESRGIGKRYGGVAALSDVSVTVRRGEIHGLCGENGAGKSTLGKIIAGGVRPDSGELLVGGRPVHYGSPRDAIRDGITMISQELALVPQLSVLDNVFLGREHGSAGLLDRRLARRHYQEIAERIGLPIDPTVEVGELRTAQQQQVEIIRALARDAELIVMDEPTAALSRPDVDRLHGIIRNLRAEGVTIIYVSHLLADLLETCDSVTVLKDGRFVKTSLAAKETVDSLVTSMLGRKLEQQFPESVPVPAGAPTVLRVRGLTRQGHFEGVSLELRAGEIVGLAGLVGAGRTEIARAIFGADPAEGIVEVDGARYTRRRPARSIQRGLALLPESRKDEGLVMMRSLRENVAMAHLDEVVRAGFVRSAHERRVVGEVLASVDTRAASISMPVSELSGGNQQKVALAKWLFRRPRVLLADEPTRGIDVGAKRAIYRLIHELAADGVGVLFISSELEELLGLAHRTLVVHRGRIVDEISREQADEESIMRAAFGATDAEGHEHAPDGR